MNGSGKMKVLFAASEGSPFIKTGGLGDVVGSLPRALFKEGVDVRVVLPLYREISEEYKGQMNLKGTFQVSVGWRNQDCALWELRQEGMIHYFLGNDYYFNREGIYGHYDDAERFAFFSRAVLEVLPKLEFHPDVIHCHDWHTAIIPVLLKSQYHSREGYSEIKTLLTIHNLHYQGNFPREILGDLLGLGDEHFTSDNLEFYGCVSYLKGGLANADLISTVSSTYAEEIQTPEHGEGLDGLLHHRREDLFGIINGIDYEEYNPAKDPNLLVNYKWSLAKKQKNKELLQEKLNLPVNRETPMIAVVSRLVCQKGLELIMEAMDKLMENDVQLVVLGTGDQKYENMLREAARRHPEKLSANIFFDEILARKIYSSADIYLMPSIFEPCGISQLISMRYGTVPVVRATGGLKDTVEDINPQTGSGTGFMFDGCNSGEMFEAIKRALELYRDPSLWSRILRNLSKKDFSWRLPAREYIMLYERLRGVYQEKLYVFG